VRTQLDLTVPRSWAHAAESTRLMRKRVAPAVGPVERNARTEPGLNPHLDLVRPRPIPTTALVIARSDLTVQSASAPLRSRVAPVRWA
jgi:hypothetical protein